jgi:cation transport ATPase
MTDSLESLLARPGEQRLREYKYRFAQSVVFGLPVVALHLFGRSLGGAESARWAGLLQALLAGWVVYVAAAGMLFEGMVLLVSRRRLTADLLAAAAGVGLYVWGVVRLAPVLVGSDAGRATFTFHWSVIVTAAWTGVQWANQARKAKSPPPRGR